MQFPKTVYKKILSRHIHSPAEYNWVRIGTIDERWFLIKKFPLGRNEPKTPGGTPTSQIRGREKYT